MPKIFSPSTLRIFAVIGLVVIASTIALPALADNPAAPIPTSGGSGGSNGILSNLPSGAECLDKGKCTLCDMIQVFINVGNLILSIFAGVALIFILWNLFGMAQSRGAEEKIREAKKGIWTTLGGVVITLIVWQIVALVIVAFTDLKGVNSTLNCSGGSLSGGGLVNHMNAKNIKELVALVVGFFPQAIGAVLLLAFVANGFKWLTAGGDDEKIKEGTKGMLYAGIALALFFAAYIMLKFIIESFTKSPGSLQSLLGPETAYALGSIPNPLTGTDKHLDPPGELFGRISFMLIRFSGAVFLVMLVYAGFLYLTAQGKEESLTKAKSILLWSVLAIVVILSAYALSIFLVKSLNPGNILIQEKPI